MKCPHCQAEVEGRWADIGIGKYEYWGSINNDNRMAFLCEACEGELESEYSYQDYLDDMQEDYCRGEDE